MIWFNGTSVSLESKGPCNKFVECCRMNEQITGIIGPCAFILVLDSSMTYSSIAQFPTILVQNSWFVGHWISIWNSFSVFPFCTSSPLCLQIRTATVAQRRRSAWRLMSWSNFVLFGKAAHIQGSCSLCVIYFAYTKAQEIIWQGPQSMTSFHFLHIRKH